MFELIGVIAVLFIFFKLFKFFKRVSFSRNVINGAIVLGVPLSEAQRIWYQDAENVYKTVLECNSSESILANASPAGKSSWAIKFIYDNNSKSKY